MSETLGTLLNSLTKAIDEKQEDKVILEILESIQNHKETRAELKHCLAPSILSRVKSNMALSSSIRSLATTIYYTWKKAYGQHSSPEKEGSENKQGDSGSSSSPLSEKHEESSNKEPTDPNHASEDTQMNSADKKKESIINATLKPTLQAQPNAPRYTMNYKSFYATQSFPPLSGSTEHVPMSTMPTQFDPMNILSMQTPEGMIANYQNNIQLEQQFFSQFEPINVPSICRCPGYLYTITIDHQEGPYGISLNYLYAHTTCCRLLVSKVDSKSLIGKLNAVREGDYLIAINGTVVMSKYAEDIKIQLNSLRGSVDLVFLRPFKYLENPQQLIEYRNKLESSLNTIYTKNSELRSELYKSETKLHEYKQNLQKSEETISQLKQDLARKNYVWKKVEEKKRRQTTSQVAVTSTSSKKKDSFDSDDGNNDSLSDIDMTDLWNSNSNEGEEGSGPALEESSKKEDEKIIALNTQYTELQACFITNMYKYMQYSLTNFLKNELNSKQFNEEKVIELILHDIPEHIFWTLFDLRKTEDSEQIHVTISADRFTKIINIDKIWKNQDNVTITFNTVNLNYDHQKKCIYIHIQLLYKI